MIDKIKIFFRNNRMWMYLVEYIFISLFLSIVVIMIDARIVPLLDYIPSFLLTSVELAKVILGTLAGSLLTMTTFTFSTILVVLTMYSSDFSPRVVNNFLTDSITMKVLGVFIGGFFYCILTLFFMRNAFSEYSVLSATIAVLYAALCIIYFVIFVFRVSSSIQATKLISRLYDESYEIIERELKYREDQSSFDKYEIGVYRSKLDILSDRNGYLELIGFKDILKTLKELEVKLIIQADIGEFVAKNQEIATLYYNEDKIDENLSELILRQFSIEEERIAYNDYRFSLQKIVDIALRAVSPGINDPNTAIHCINILGVLLSKLGSIKGRYTVIRDQDSKAVVVYEDFDFKEDMYFTFYQILHYSKNDISILVSIFNALKIIIKSSTIEKKDTIREFSEYIYDTSIDNFTHDFDIKVLKRAKEAI